MPYSTLHHTPKSSIPIFSDFKPGISIAQSIPQIRCVHSLNVLLSYRFDLCRRQCHKMSFSFIAMYKHPFTKYYSLPNPADLCLYMYHLYPSSRVPCCISFSNSLHQVCDEYSSTPSSYSNSNLFILMIRSVQAEVSQSHNFPPGDKINLFDCTSFDLRHPIAAGFGA